tara:strand:- start:1414 stop:2106 length:693 start_codon:yes stop_codon:yes gene_type:complete
MTPEEETEEFGPDRRGHKSRERKCLALNEVRDPADMIRFVRDPENNVVPDITGKLPGRGVWVSADLENLKKAIKSGAFPRGFKSKVTVPNDMVGLVEDGLKRSVLGLLSMAKKSGRIALGFDQVIALARDGSLGLRIEAQDGAADGRGKIRTLSRAVARELERNDPPVIGCFTAHELGDIMGRDKLVHAGLGRGRLSRRLREEAHRLSGFVALVPTDWADYAHEVKPKEE